MVESSTPDGASASRARNGQRARTSGRDPHPIKWRQGNYWTLHFTRRSVRRLSVNQEIFRLRRDTWQALQSRFGSTIYRRSVAAASTIRILPKNDRHSLRVKNIGSVDLRIASSQAAADGSTAYIELNVGEEKYFRIHYNALQGYSESVALVVFHSEWDDELWVRNTDTAIAGTIEAREVY